METVSNSFSVVSGGSSRFQGARGMFAVGISRDFHGDFGRSRMTEESRLQINWKSRLLKDVAATFSLLIAN